MRLCNNVHFVWTLAASVIINARHSPDAPAQAAHVCSEYALLCWNYTYNVLCFVRASGIKQSLAGPASTMRIHARHAAVQTLGHVLCGTQHACTILPSRTNDEFADVCLPCVCVWARVYGRCYAEVDSEACAEDRSNWRINQPTDRPTDKPTDNRLHK